MSFAVLPPELNSARMYAGAGLGPMLAAAAAWDELTTELGMAATSFESVISGLAGGGWQGPASLAMASAAAPYVGWLTAAAGQAERTAGQARAAASAFEAAQAATVHPAMVASNRAARVWLVASNLLGQNTPAIAAAEAEYEQMWAQDVAAMAAYYADASALAARLTPWPQSLQNLAQPMQSGVGKIIAMPMLGPGTALIMGGTGNPQPDPVYVANIGKLFITPNFPGYTAQGVYTPEQWWPFTSFSLRPPYFTTSVGDGLKNLNAAIMAQYAAGTNTAVFGYSQSAGIATLEMRYLEGLPAGQKPDPSQLSFLLAGNPNRPDGGFYERFNSPLSPLLQALGFQVAGTTPTNVYPTTDYAIQYDGIADFPQYPIDIFADANAVAGMVFLHPFYGDLTPAQLALGVAQPVSPADTQTTYILIPTQNLPLLDPLRAIPFVGNPLADLVQPDLRVLVDLGYDRAAYQDVPTMAGLFPHVDVATVAAELQQGAGQGVHDAIADL
jgi:PPE-repeat protein